MSSSPNADDRPRLDHPPATLSFNLYCDRDLHAPLRDVVTALEGDLVPLAGPGALLWFFRYSRCGRHLKVRLHTDDEACLPALRGHVQLLADGLFANLSADSTDGERVSGPRLPPIDEEDERDEDYPDRSLLWTRFRPSPRTVGNEKYLTDDRMLNLFYRCMSANSGLVLSRTRESESEPALKSRQSQLLQTLIGGFFALGMSEGERLSYLAFHRDWLLRHQLVQASADTKAEETLERLDQKLAGMEGTVAALSAIVAGRLVQEEPGEEDEEDSGLSRLQASLRDFFTHVRGFRGRPDYDLDPYTTDYAFLPLFKVLHGFANQIGVPIVNELYSYQLLLRATERAYATAAALEADRR